MSINQEMALKGLSVSYVADEDRLLLEILFEGSSIPQWITRRGALKLIEIFNQQLAKKSSQSSDSIIPDTKAPIAFERDIAATKNPPRPGEMKLNLQQERSGEARVGVLKTLQFTDLGTTPPKYQLNFIDTHEKSFQMKAERDLLLNLETMLLQQIDIAQW